MNLPEKDYFTFSDLCTRFNCSIAYLHHLVVTEKLRPSIFIDGRYVRICWKDVNGELVALPQQADAIDISGLMFLASIRQNGAHTYEFKHCTMLCDADRYTSTYPDPWDNPLYVNQWFQFEWGEEITERHVEANAVFMRDVVEKFEETFASASSTQTELMLTNALPTNKSVTAYVNIIGALCDLYWRAAFPNDSKLVQARIIEVLIDKYSDFHGLSERNLKEQISKAVKAIRNE